MKLEIGGRSRKSRQTKIALEPLSSNEHTHEVMVKRSIVYEGSIEYQFKSGGGVDCRPRDALISQSCTII